MTLKLRARLLPALSCRRLMPGRPGVRPVHQSAAEQAFGHCGQAAGGRQGRGLDLAGSNLR